MFLTTVNPTSMYKFIVNSCKLNAEREQNKKLSIVTIKFKKFPSLRFFFYFVSFIFFGKIFLKEERIYLKYLNIEIGRFITSATFKDIKSYENKFSFYKIFLQNFYKAGVILNSAEYYYKKIKFKYIYIDHCGYLNGILYSFFLKKKFIYTNNYPKNIFLTSPNCDSTYEKNLQIKKINQKINKRIFLSSSKFLTKLINNPKIIPWITHAKFNQLKKIPNIKEYQYIIYTHSFTDGQLWFGNDGFENTYDWLDFTLKNLDASKKKTLIKCHPNFTNKVFGITAFNDLKVFNKIYQKYKNNKNFYFIMDAVLNSNIMKQINNNCIAITHHGNVIFELAHKNFKIIASQAIFFSNKYKITNSWKNPQQYLNLLHRSYNDLIYPDKKDLYDLTHNLFFNPRGYYGKKNLNTLIAQNLNNKGKKIIMQGNMFNPSVNDDIFIKYISTQTQNKICKVLSNNILT